MYHIKFKSKAKTTTMKKMMMAETEHIKEDQLQSRKVTYTEQNHMRHLIKMSSSSFEAKALALANNINLNT